MKEGADIKMIQQAEKLNTPSFLQENRRFLIFILKKCCMAMTQMNTLTQT